MSLPGKVPLVLLTVSRHYLHDPVILRPNISNRRNSVSGDAHTLNRKDGPSPNHGSPNLSSSTRSGSGEDAFMNADVLVNELLSVKLGPDGSSNNNVGPSPSSARRLSIQKLPHSPRDANKHHHAGRDSISYVSSGRNNSPYQVRELVKPFKQAIVLQLIVQHALRSPRSSVVSLDNFPPAPAVITSRPSIAVLHIPPSLVAINSPPLSPAVASPLANASSPSHSASSSPSSTPISASPSSSSSSLSNESSASKPPTRASGQSIASIAEAYPLNLLLAEDNPTNSKVMLMFLRKLGYLNVPLRTDGTEVYEAITKDQIHPRPDCILMDVSMAPMTGLVCTKMLREWERSQNDRMPLYIVAQTANANSESKEECFLSGMDAFLRKPINIDHLSAMLQQASNAIRRRKNSNNSKNNN
eukprot:TRINITY_DN7992_c0_g2_i4.p1 TRINITY_DN7992_c0_g2~~TRINITY_DN7992_c0_g2_i4.p1  ORF type:complete len:475 (-),score=94.55 TRINITY_DN7992_c0_g2_i4:717-1961(-)